MSRFAWWYRLALLLQDERRRPLDQFCLERKSTFLYLTTAVFQQYGAAITMEKAQRMRKLEQNEVKTELIVYSCHHVERGPELHIFDEDDIQAAGGMYNVERELQRDSYWVVRLGTIEGEESVSGWSCTDEALAGLPEADPGGGHLGRRNPSFQRGQLERLIFQSLFQSLSAFLKGWNHEEDGLINAYTLRMIKISPNRLSSIAGALTSIRRAHDVIGLTVLKYWYDPEWKMTWPSNDLILAEFSLVVPLQFRWGNGEGVVTTDILTLSSC